MYNIVSYGFPENFSAALLVIIGVYGNGDQRVELLTQDGYVPSIVQACVNDILKVMEKYG